MEYINKQQILEKAKQHQNNPFGASLIIAEIEKADGVDVKHGEWIKKEDSYFCSECDSENCYAFCENIKKFTDYYCPNCGAKMGGDINDL